MKRLTSLFIFLLVSCSITLGQDIITKRNGDEITVKVIEITPTEIKYRKFDNPDGPLYVVLKSEVFMIRYANGEKEVVEITEVKTERYGTLQSSVRLQAEPRLSLASDFWGRNIHVDGMRVSKGRVSEIMKEAGVLDAYGKYSKGRTMQLVGGIVGLASAFPFGMCLGLIIYASVDDYYYLSGGEIALTVICGTVFVGSYVLSGIGNSMIKGSLNLYNAKLYNRTTSMTLDYGLTPNGVGLCLRF